LKGATMDQIKFDNVQFITLIAALMPEPSKADIESQLELDIARNPHNDYHLPKRRTQTEVIAQLKVASAIAICNACYENPLVLKGE